MTLALLTIKRSQRCGGEFLYFFIGCVQMIIEKLNKSFESLKLIINFSDSNNHLIFDSFKSLYCEMVSISKNN